MKGKFSYIIVEDVELQRQNLIDLLSSRLDLELLESMENAEEAFDFIANESNPQPDLIFLDIEMPEANGLSFLHSIKRFRKNSRVILTTAFSGYAIKGYDFDVSAYLLKPIETERLHKAVDKAIAELGKTGATESEGKKSALKGHLLIKEQNKRIKIDYDEILYIEGANVNIKIITANQTYLTRERIKTIAATLPEHSFQRIHDSFIINLDYIKSYANNFAFIDLCFSSQSELFTLKVGPKYRSAIRKQIRDRFRTGA